MPSLHTFISYKSVLTLSRFLSPYSTILFLILQPVSGATALPQMRETPSHNTQVVKPKPEDANPPDRSSLSLPNALLGHWVSDKSKTHMYYRERGFISVFSGKAHQGTYRIEAVDEKESEMRIRITPTHYRVLTFSLDKREISDIAEVAGIKAEEAIVWRYLDNSQEPSSQTLESTATQGPTLEFRTAPERPEFIIGDRKTKIYYWSDCREYKDLPLQRRVYFKTKKDAERSGYRAAKNCL